MSKPRSKLAGRLDAVSVSPTMAVMMEAKALRARGVDVIDFGPGEPDFNTPENIKRAGAEAIAGDLTHYTDASGILELRQALAARYRDRHGTPWTETEVITGVGGKNILFLLSMALFEPGDRVAIYAPYWVSFPEQIRLCGAEPVLIPTDGKDGLVSRAADLDAHAENLKAVILNSPGNPSGAVIPPEEVARFVRFSEKTGVLIVSDETYDSFHYGPGEYASFAAHAGRLADRLVIVNSVSKTYAMTGWRVGYALGPKPIIQAIKKVQSHDATHTCSISQAAALEAIRGPQESVAEMREEYRRRRDELVPALNRIRGIHCTMPGGAFYVYPNVEGGMRALKCETSIDFAGRLMKESAVACVPGEAFGMPGHVRLSYALSIERIRQGLGRMRDLLGGEEG